MPYFVGLSNLLVVKMDATVQKMNKKRLIQAFLPMVVVFNLLLETEGGFQTSSVVHNAYGLIENCVSSKSLGFHWDFGESPVSSANRWDFEAARL